MKNDSLLPASVQLKPMLSSLRKIRLINATDNSSQALSSESDYCSHFWMVPEKVPHCFLMFEPTHLNSSSTDLSLDDFVRATYNLIREYDKPNYISLKPFVEYCTIYGPLFWGITEKTSFQAIYINDALIRLGKLLWLINNTSHDKVHNLSKALSTVIELNSDLDEIYISLENRDMVKSMIMFHSRHAVNSTEPDIIKNFIKRKYHIFPDLLPEIGLVVGKVRTEGYPKNLPISLRIPNFCLKFTINDLYILKGSKTNQKYLLLRHKLLEVMDPIIKFQAPKVILDADKPIIQSFVKDPLSVFLLKILIDIKNFNTCLYCGELTASGQKYCNHDHKERYRRSTPKGKLDNLLRQWFVGDAKIKITEEIKNILLRYGNFLLDYGLDYKNEVLPRIQKAKTRLLNK